MLEAVIGVGNTVADRARVLVDLVVVAALVGLVAEEVDGGVLDAIWLLGIGLEVLEAVGLVPAGWEDVEGDLTADGVAVLLLLELGRMRCEWRGVLRQANIRKLLAEHIHKRLADLVLQIVLLVLIPLLRTRITPNGANIDHPIPELDKRAPLNRNIQIRNIMQDELDQLLIPILANPIDEALARQQRAQLVRRQPVLGEAEVEARRDAQRRRAQLLLLLHEVRAAHVAHGDFLAKVCEHLDHLGGAGLGGKSVGTVWVLAVRRDLLRARG